MFRFASRLACRVRLARNGIQPIGGSGLRLCSSRNYAVDDIKLGDRDNHKLGLKPKDHEATEDRFLPYSMKNDGAAGFMRQVANPSCDMDEHGRKYFSVLGDFMAVEVINALDAGVIARDLVDGVSIAFETVMEHLKHRARMVNSFEEIGQVGTVAANGNRKIGQLIAKAMENVGEEGFYVISDRKTARDELEFVKAMKLNWGCIAPYFITNKKKQISVLKNPLILIHENQISNANVVKLAIGPAQCRQRPLLIVAEDVNREVVGSLILDRLCWATEVCVIKPPKFVENTKEIMEDLAILTGSRVVTGASDVSIIPLMLGSCKEVTVSYDDTFILGGSGNPADIEGRCEKLRSTIDSGGLDYEMEELLEERLAKLSHGAAVFKVGGASKAKVNKMISNALNAAKAAAKGGIIPGGGVALLHASKELDKLQITNPGQKIGAQIVQNALKMPVYTIAASAGFDGSVIVEKLLKLDNPDFGYNPARGEYIDMMKSGNFDPLNLVIKELKDISSYNDAGSLVFYDIVRTQRKLKEAAAVKGSPGL